MALVPPEALRLDVGKLPGEHRAPQPEINALLVDLARRGLDVVRLKGGDPYIFGGSEEAEHLRRHGIEFDVAPGITSAAACAAAIGVPLTHRGMANGVRYVTGDRPRPFSAARTRLAFPRRSRCHAGHLTWGCRRSPASRHR